MANTPRFLIGFGERLTEPVPPPPGGGGAPPPYSPEQARERLRPQIQRAARAARQLPAAACPADRVVSVLTLHPSFIAKSHFPGQLLRAVGLEPVGSRPRHLVPELNMHQSTVGGVKRFEARPGEDERPTTELFVESSRAALDAWALDVEDDRAIEGGPQTEIVVVEEYRLPSVEERLRLPADLPEEVALEVVLHAAGDTAHSFVLEAFEAYAEQIGVTPDLDRRLPVGGLCFIPTSAPSDQIEALAEFSFLRVARPMPRLRLLEPLDTIARAADIRVTPPEQPPVDPDIRVAVFDGGVETGSPLAPWVSSKDAPGIADPVPDYLDHGLMVSSALLFGSIDPDAALPVPFAHVDHYRVLDVDSDRDPYELYDVIRRIESVLTQNEYPFVNLSIGPSLPIEDDEVHSWTAFLDQHLADGRTLATIAIGNNGQNDRDSGNARVQVPGDAVNALCVGAANSQADGWKRAPYSAFGPGRTPGLVKPDVVAFGGVPTEPFLTVAADLTVTGTRGTSFASPATLRTALGVRGLFGERLDPLALKALLIHTADQCDEHDPHEHGWGRVCPDLEPIVVCPDGMARVVYQGTLTAGKYLRAQLPVPSEQLKGNVKITATLCFASEIEPDQPSNYTRSGLEVVFRPDEDRFNSPGSTVARTSPFFGQRSYASEAELRADAHKWETVLHEANTKRGSSLNNPVFDIHYNARVGGHDGTSLAPKLRYAMVITVESAHTPDLYDQVLRTYATRLEALVPRLDVPLRIDTEG